MTTRFSLAELADMLHVPVPLVRRAVEALAAEGALTAESFVYMERNWRIAPSDVKRIQEWIARAGEMADGGPSKPVVRRVKRKQVVDAPGGTGS